MPRSAFTSTHRLLLFALALGFSWFAIAQWSRAYIDFGDGNYLYIATRIAAGDVVYRDILAPQPPCHLFLGAAIVKLAQWGGLDPILCIRATSLLIRLAMFALVVLLAWRAWGRAAVAVAAGALFLWFPIGFWWSMGYQSEPLELLFLLLMIACSLAGTAGRDIWAGLFAGLAGLTNATAAPFLLVLILYMLLRAPRRALRMAVPCVLLVGIVTAGLQAWTGGAYLDNVVFNQVGTYPDDSLAVFLNYAWGKLVGQGSKVLALEGAALVLALAGLGRYLRESPLPQPARGGLGWFCLGTMGSIIYVTKGGTADYIFSLGEPAIAILAAGELHAWVRRLRAPTLPPQPAVGPAGILAEEEPVPAFWGQKTVAALMLALFALLPGLNFYRLLWSESAFELGETESNHVAQLIRRHSDPNQPVLAPPWYAVVAGRPLWGHYSEIFIWTINYANDMEALSKGQRTPENPGPGVAKIRAMAQALAARQIPIVVLELDQTGRLPEVMLTLRAQYEPLRYSGESFIARTLNTRLGFFVPALPGETPEQRTRRDERWTAFLAEITQLYGPQQAPRTFGAWWGRLALGQ